MTTDTRIQLNELREALLEWRIHAVDRFVEGRPIPEEDILFRLVCLCQDLIVTRFEHDAAEVTP